MKKSIAFYLLGTLLILTTSGLMAVRAFSDVSADDARNRFICSLRYCDIESAVTYIDSEHIVAIRKGLNRFSQDELKILALILAKGELISQTETKRIYRTNSEINGILVDVEYTFCSNPNGQWKLSTNLCSAFE